MNHTVLPANYTTSAFKRLPDGATTDCGSGHLIAAYYSFINPGRMKGLVGLVGRPVADGFNQSVNQSQNFFNVPIYTNKNPEAGAQVR